MFDLKDKTAVVTGGAKGLGAATAKLLREAGARVEVLDLSTGCDVTDEAQVNNAFAGIGGLDILVNNAGRAIRKSAVEVAKEDWDAVIELNLTALFLCSRLAHPHMKKRGGGAIVNLASIMGLSGGIYPNASYQASKGGVVNLTRALALEWASDNIRVNSVHPGPVRTPMTAGPDAAAAVAAEARRLAIPRVAALIVTLPILTFFADVMGLLGGGVMYVTLANETFAQYVGRLNDVVTATQFWVGMVKAPVFAILIALVGCFEGLRVTGSAESVGQMTTRSVVEGIFLVIIFDALFSILFAILNI